MTLTDQEVIERREDAEMLQRPHLWPHPQLLPVKKPGWRDSGVVPAVKYDGRLRVYHANFVEMGLRAQAMAKEAGTPGTSLGDLLAEYEYTEYTDAWAVVDDGWVVD